MILATPHTLPRAVLSATLLLACAAPAWALPPQETRTTFYSSAAKTRQVGSLTQPCSGSQVRRGQQTEHEKTVVLRRCGRPVVPDPKPRCELQPGGCRQLPGG